MSTKDSNEILDQIRSRQQIEEQLHRWARGADRIDIEEMQSVFHPKANINYGYSNGPVEEFLPWVVKFHSEELVWTSHWIVNLLIKFEENKAHSEAGVDCCLRYKGKDGLADLIVAGRYLDRWERRDGEWRIIDRTSVLDRYRTSRVEQSAEADPWVKKVNMGVRTKDDLSYHYV
jgi:hypothetical protein